MGDSCQGPIIKSQTHKENQNPKNKFPNEEPIHRRKFIMKKIIITLSLLLTAGLIVRAEETSAAPQTPSAAPAEQVAAETPVEQVAAETPAQPSAKPVKKKKKKKAQKIPAVTPQTAAPASIPTVKVEAPQKSNEGLQNWLKNLRKKINNTQSKPNKLVAVGAVRGDDTQDPAPLYWKGKHADGAAGDTELTEFNAALDLAMNGDTAGSKSKLETFISAHPQSPMAVSYTHLTLPTIYSV